MLLKQNNSMLIESHYVRGIILDLSYVMLMQLYYNNEITFCCFNGITLHFTGIQYVSGIM